MALDWMMATVRQPISRLPLVTEISAFTRIPVLNNPNSPNKQTVAVTADTLAQALVELALAKVLIRVAVFINNRPLDDEIIVRYQFPEAVEFPLELQESVGSSIIPATDEAVFTFEKNGAPFGTATFPAGQSVAFFAGGGDQFITGDVLTFRAPLVTDLTLGGISITLAGGRTLT